MVSPPRSSAGWRWRRCVELRTQRRHLHPAEDLGGETIRQEPACLVLADAAALQIEQGARVERSHRRAVRALHVISVDLELRLAVGVRLAREQEVVVRLL